MMKNSVSIFLWIAVLAWLAILAAGYSVGEKYSGTQKVYFNYKVPYVWEVLNDFENSSSGKSDVKSVETLSKYYNFYAWKEKLKNGGFRNYKQIEKEQNKSITLELFDSSYGLTGTWKFLIEEENQGTIVTIEETSTNKSILRRGLLYYIDKGRETTSWIKYLRVRLYNKLLATP